MKKSFIEKHFDDDNPLTENDIDMDDSKSSGASMKDRVLKPIYTIGAFLLLIQSMFWLGLTLYTVIGGWIADAIAYNELYPIAAEYVESYYSGTYEITDSKVKTVSSVAFARDISGIDFIFTDKDDENKQIALFVRRGSNAVSDVREIGFNKSG